MKMSKVIASSVLLISTHLFACPGSTSIEIDTPQTKITGDKVDGVVYFTNKKTGKISTVELHSFASDTTFMVDAKDDKKLSFKIVELSKGTYVYNVDFDGNTSQINPNLIARGISECGFKLIIE
ncbi:MAG: hypothetical protein QE271_05730 [Bacteriovoracaceae bacterium]|nr:hypothetical protein [Bacteriovoracaceae bacterium]